MRHRRFYNFSNRSGVNQNQHPGYIYQENSYNPRVHMPSRLGRGAGPGSGSFHYLADNLSRGRYALPQSNAGRRENEYFSSSSRMEVPMHEPVFPGPTHDPYSHSTAARSFNLIPESNVLHIGYHDRLTSHEMNQGPFNHMTGSQRVSFKRKTPDDNSAIESGITSQSYVAGSFSHSSSMLPEGLTPVYEDIPRMPSGFPHYRGTSHYIASEDTWRNVRSYRRPEFGHNTDGTHLFNYTSPQDHSMVNPTYHSSINSHTRLFSEATMQQWNSDPLSDGIIGSRGIAIGGPSEQTYWPTSRQRTRGVGVYPGDFMSSQHSPLPHYVHGGLTDAGDTSGMLPSYRTDMSYPHPRHGAAFLDIGHLSIAESSSSRYASPLSAGWWRSASGHGMSGAVSERSHSVPGMVDDETMASESFVMVNDSFSSRPNSSFDEYGEMSLDIDSMGYEELLALGERMGDVCTGLAEDMILKCLKETKYNSSVQNKETSCAICLEEYKQKDAVGAIKNCGHDYHLGCIKTWLMMKNVCPVCRGAALLLE